ncbi:MAG: IS1182 family transposase [Ferrimicrobium acidiphilum]
MPPSLDDWLPKDHTARFISEVVDELLDLSVIYASYVEASGAPPYDPTMMLKILLYAYSTGVTSSREMEKRCHIDIAFRWLSANTTPDYRSLARFRRRHEKALGDLFNQVLVLCSEAGLVKLGRVALDGTKLRASASRRKSMSYERLGPRIADLEAQVATILAEAEATDLAEDEAFGVDKRGDEIPEELRRRETRIAKMRQAKEAIEAEAQAKADERAKVRTERTEKVNTNTVAAPDPARQVVTPDPKAQATKRQESKAHAVDNARDANAADATKTEVNTDSAIPATPIRPNPKAQRSFTDPESRMMKTNDGFQFAYNAQAVVDEGSQVIVATKVTQAAVDVNELIPMVEATTTSLKAANITRSPRVFLADAGYCSEANLGHLTELNINALIATGRMKHNERASESPRGRIPKNATRRERMARRLRTKPGRIDYARRKAIVEPVFGQMKVRQKAGHLRLRGLSGAETEWMLHSICPNLRKLSNARVNAGLVMA